MTNILNRAPVELEDAAIEYVSRAVTALTAQVRVLGDPDYLRRFSPSQLAAVHSVMADKAARLIEVMQLKSKQHSTEFTIHGGNDTGFRTE